MMYQGTGTLVPGTGYQVLRKSNDSGTKLNAVSTCFGGEKSPQKAAADGAAENIRVKS